MGPFIAWTHAFGLARAKLDDVKWLVVFPPMDSDLVEVALPDPTIAQAEDVGLNPRRRFSPPPKAKLLEQRIDLLPHRCDQRFSRANVLLHPGFIGRHRRSVSLASSMSSVFRRYQRSRFSLAARSRASRLWAISLISRWDAPNWKPNSGGQQTSLSSGETSGARLRQRSEIISYSRSNSKNKIGTKRVRSLDVSL